VLLAALAAPAGAYVRSSDPDTGAELHWATPIVPYHVSDLPLLGAPSCDAGGSADPTLDAVRASFSAWHQGCANLELVLAGRIPEIRTGSGGTRENLVAFRRGWCSQNPDASSHPCMTDDAVDCGGLFGCFEDQTQGDRLIVALTTVLYDPDSGRIMDADIEVNGWDGVGPGASLSSGSSGPPHGWYFTCEKQAAWSSCTTYDQPGCYYIDLQNTLTHEVGHFVGLAHPCEGVVCSSQPQLRPLTMYPDTAPGDVEKRTLAADDVAGVCDIYPAQGGGSGCGAGGASGGPSFLFAIAALVGVRRRARRAQATSRPA
jgi:hypothetical protein